MAMFVPKDRRSLFRQFLAGMYDAVVITDPNGYILEVNQRTVEYFGRERDGLMDQPVSLLIPGLKQEVVTRIRKGLEGDRHVVVDANAVSQAGQKIACEVAVSQIDLMNPGDLIFIIRNVERRRAYLASLRTRANSFELAENALFGCNAEGKIIEANAAFLEMFGLESLEHARQHCFADFMSDQPLPERFQQALAGEKTVTSIVAEGDGDDQEEIEITLAPDVHNRRTVGVVGCIVKL